MFQVTGTRIKGQNNQQENYKKNKRKKRAITWFLNSTLILRVRWNEIKFHKKGTLEWGFYLFFRTVT